MTEADRVEQLGRNAQNQDRQMGYAAQVLEVMIASPGDVVSERQIVREVLNAWNVVHSRARNAMLVPVGWETHSAPELGGRAQQMINDRLLAHCDLLVGIFWTRLGSPTGVAASGTVEEIEEHIKAGKPAMLYFSKAPVVPDSLDQEQYAKLKEFKDWAMGEGLVAQYDSPEEFRESFRRDLELNLRDSAYLAEQISTVGSEVRPGDQVQRVTLSDAASKLLIAAGTSDDGHIMILRSLGGTHVQAGREQMIKEDRTEREAARWVAGVEELERYGLVEATSYKREVFRLTHAGWEAASAVGEAAATAGG